MIFRRSPFKKIVAAQLDLFVREHRDVIEDVHARLQAYHRGPRTQAEELYGDYVDAVETGTEILADMRDHYARTVSDPDEYVRAFNRAVEKRWPIYGLEIENR